MIGYKKLFQRKHSFFPEIYQSYLPWLYFRKRCDEWAKSCVKRRQEGYKKQIPGASRSSRVYLSLFTGQFHQCFLVGITYRQLQGSDHNRTFSYNCDKVHGCNIRLVYPDKPVAG